MGGLVSRNYALPEEKVRRLVTLGTPNYGGLFADTFIGDGILNNQAEDLETGSPVTWKIPLSGDSQFFRLTVQVPE